LENSSRAADRRGLLSTLGFIGPPVRFDERQIEGSCRLCHMSPRKRIGVMVPSTNTTCEADFTLVVPRGVTVHGQRLWMTDEANGDAAYERMNAEIETGARYLATARVDAVAYGCTTGSFYRGPGWDRDMLALIEREARQATIWMALGAIGVTAPMRGFGRLFERPAPTLAGAGR
jgi:maleate cis-trans isomerase